MRKMCKLGEEYFFFFCCAAFGHTKGWLRACMRARMHAGTTCRRQEITSASAKSTITPEHAVNLGPMCGGTVVSVARKGIKRYGVYIRYC